MKTHVLVGGNQALTDHANFGCSAFLKFVLNTLKHSG